MACYVANFGTPDLDEDQEQANPAPLDPFQRKGPWGPFYRNSKTKLREITDGLSHTLMVGERQNGPFRTTGSHGVHIEYETTWAGAVGAWIGSAADLDWFRLPAPASGTFRADARSDSTAGADPGLALFERVGEGLSARLERVAQAAGSVVATLVAGRSYYLRVDAGSAGVRAYGLGLRLDEFDGYAALAGIDEARADYGLDGAGYSVVVLDTGIDLGHPDYAGRVLASQSFIPNQPVQDGHSHGTHCAGTAAGARNRLT